ncbi:spore cortex-lytic enzyme [Serpentinicella alkaliphila]|uniref:Spore cortex-lytic enzyme n=1 Tax=Serpentinicella alkaliphila TaxID=1734049 RepID=A0A4R2TLR4_9FIRM|nr:spore cortex-lytic enzyme [Serpentinicella alkaliphila]QUH24546.1 spore cortex-lytic enzyme [Serpentinicella alkaliphila]TCQ04640.1 N-acetylmuramoyl-L-alanine amidase [Serpentinicella alkaliphila]
MSRTKNISIFLITIILFSVFGYMGAELVHGQTLSWGSQGEDVTLMQTRLRNWGFYDGPISGIFGQQTYDAVVRFQRANGLAADGIVGPQTRVAIGLPTRTGGTTTPASRGVSRSDDVHLLARTIHSESRGEPYEGQVAVGAVILNRVRSPQFPNTLAGVVYQPCAFEPVKNGAINQEPGESAYRAARDALNGWDPTGGALYFWNPATATSPWIWTRRITLRIGRHVFGV